MPYPFWLDLVGRSEFKSVPCSLPCSIAGDERVPLGWYKNLLHHSLNLRLFAGGLRFIILYKIKTTKCGKLERKLERNDLDTKGKDKNGQARSC